MLQITWCTSSMPLNAAVKFGSCRVGFDHAAWAVSLWKLAIYWKTGDCHNRLYK